MKGKGPRERQENASVKQIVDDSDHQDQLQAAIHNKHFVIKIDSRHCMGMQNILDKQCS